MAWDFFAHIRMMELLYHKMQAPVLEQYQLTQIELDVLLFLAHHPHLDTAKDIVEVRRLTKSHVSAGNTCSGCSTPATRSSSTSPSCPRPPRW